MSDKQSKAQMFLNSTKGVPHRSSNNVSSDEAIRIGQSDLSEPNSISNDETSVGLLIDTVFSVIIERLEDLERRVKILEGQSPSN